MSRISKYYKRIRASFLQAAIFIMFIYVFFIPNVTWYESQGDNYFTMILNGTQIGYLSEVEAIDEILREARTQVAAKSEDMVYARTDVEIISQEVYFGKIDTYRTLVERSAAVLEDSVIETLGHAYTLKMNEYSVNLADSEEVIALLEASLQEYDAGNDYQVNLVLDPARELNALTAEVVNSSEQEAQEELPTFPQAGTEQYFSEIFDAIEPAGEKDFDDFEYGLTMMDFSEEVEVVEAFLMDSELTPLTEAIDEVTKEKEVNVIYEVVAGDTLSGISEKTDIPVERIIELNDNLEDETSTIRIGDELIVTVPEPELSVERTELVYLEEDYDAEVIYIENDEWYTTDEVVRQEPSAGHRNVAALISYHNDKEVSREIVKEEVLLEAVPKIVERGTKIPPSYIWPMSGGRLTSRFGRRTAPTRGASSNHKGIDLAVATGTSVMASSGGTVTKAGWGGGYGYVVYIRHPDGMETRYAHLSKVLVSSGQYVKQGQKIALSGNTGVSTGPHLHFEMRKNGTPVNPQEYLSW